LTPRVEIEVVGAQGSILLRAVVDTGFDGEVCLPAYLESVLGLEYGGTYTVEYADGREELVPVAGGSVRFLGEVLPVDITLTGSEDAMIGTALLADCTLFIDFTTGEVRIEKKQASG
jgi:clan AA aspartic protease